MAINVNAVRADQGYAPATFIGDLSFRLKDAAGNWGPLHGPIMAAEVSLDPGKANMALLKSALVETFAQIIGAVVTPGDPSITIKIEDSGLATLMLALRGTSTAITENSGTATDATATPTAKGAWLQLPHRNVSATDFAGKCDTTDLTVSTDYILDDMYLLYGKIYIPSTSTIDLSKDCTWTFTYGAVSGYHIDAQQIPDMRIQIEMPVYNRATQDRGMLTVWEAAVSPSSGLDVAANKNQTISFTGVPMTPSGKTGPFFIEMLKFA
jgi:hypothetical protein